MVRIQDRAARNIAQAKAEAEIVRVEGQARLEIARIEGQRRIAEQNWEHEIMRYKHQLARSKRYEPYQAAKEEGEKRELRNRRTAERREEGLGFGTLRRCIKSCKRHI